MMAAVLVVDPILEADLEPEQYAYRRDRSALDAVKYVHTLINTGHVEIVDADLSAYFDTLPHAELLKSVARLREPDALIAHVRFDERDVETEHGLDSEAPADERAGNG
jgi:RNA-directed DNA polymerase